MLVCAAARAAASAGSRGGSAARRVTGSVISHKLSAMHKTARSAEASLQKDFIACHRCSTMLSGAKPKVNYGLARCHVAFKTGIPCAIKAGMAQEAQLAVDRHEQLQT